MGKETDHVRRAALADAAAEMQRLHDLHDTNALRIYQNAYANARDHILRMIVAKPNQDDK